MSRKSLRIFLGSLAFGALCAVGGMAAFVGVLYLRQLPSEPDVDRLQSVLEAMERGAARPPVDVATPVQTQVLPTAAATQLPIVENKPERAKPEAVRGPEKTAEKNPSPRGVELLSDQPATFFQLNRNAP
ncbi:MAG: hypothetical protein ACKVP7_15550 [Hyphomicrobiaceae bacterium]